MTVQARIAFWGGGALLVCVLLYLLSGILLPFVAGLILAYLLDPLVNRLVQLRVGRVLASALVIVSAIVILAVVITLLSPLIAHQFTDFITALPAIVTRLQSIIMEKSAPLLQLLGNPRGLGDVETSFGPIAAQSAGWLAGFATSLLSSGQAFVGVLSLLIITPVVTFYLLCDWKKMLISIDSWLPRRHVSTLHRLLGEMDSAMSGFMRGQFLVCLFLGTFYGVGLGLLGIKSGVLIGIMTGVLSFIPYVGSTLGLVTSVGVALAQFWPEWTIPLMTLALFIVGQFIEGNFLTPKLVGASVGLHPVWLLFALLAFGSLFGFVGLLLAVPIAAIIGVLCRFALEEYLSSPLYDPDRVTHTARPRSAVARKV